jgi:hypothetical protein
MRVLYMVLERSKDGSARGIYERFEQQGRMAPAGLEYIDSWVDADVTRCFQLMRTDDPDLLTQWAAHWTDLVEFEFIPVISGNEAAAIVRNE